MSLLRYIKISFHMTILAFFFSMCIIVPTMKVPVGTAQDFVNAHVSQPLGNVKLKRNLINESTNN